jgi:hypothetical protein
MTTFVDDVKAYIKNEKKNLKGQNLIVQSSLLVEGQYGFYELHGLTIVSEFFIINVEIKEIYEETYSPNLWSVEHLLVDFEFKMFKRFIKNVKQTFSSYNYEIFINTILSQLIKEQGKYYNQYDSPFAKFMVGVQRGLMRKIYLYRIYNDI